MLRIGQLARLIGRHPEVVRRYEKAGIIPPAQRDPHNGWRVWSDEEARRIQEEFQPVQPKQGAADQ